MPVVQAETLLFENGIERRAEGHELRFDAFDERSLAKSFKHFEEKLFAGFDLREARRGEKAADQAFLLFKDVEAIARRVFAVPRGLARQRMRIDKFPDQMLRRTVVPVKIVAPLFRLFVKEGFERTRMDLAQIDNLHAWPE